jgi:hypothetical protein
MPKTTKKSRRRLRRPEAKKEVTQELGSVLVDDRQPCGFCVCCDLHAHRTSSKNGELRKMESNIIKLERELEIAESLRKKAEELYQQLRKENNYNKTKLKRLNNKMAKEPKPKEQTASWDLDASNTWRRAAKARQNWTRLQNSWLEPNSRVS